jgi:hypothetical protein
MTRLPDLKPEHRWSGWPGAYCLNCWIDDKRELCLADGHDLECDRPECRNGPCPGYVGRADAKRRLG